MIWMQLLLALALIVAGLLLLSLLHRRGPALPRVRWEQRTMYRSWQHGSIHIDEKITIRVPVPDDGGA